MSDYVVYISDYPSLCINISLSVVWYALLSNFVSICQPVCLIVSQQALTLHKKWSFPLSISSVNVTKSVVFCRLRHINWRNPQWKNSFFVQCYIWLSVCLSVCLYIYLSVCLSPCLYDCHSVCLSFCLRDWLSEVALIFFACFFESLFPLNSSLVCCASRLYKPTGYTSLFSIEVFWVYNFVHTNFLGIQALGMQGYTRLLCILGIQACYLFCLLKTPISHYPELKIQLKCCTLQIESFIVSEKPFLHNLINKVKLFTYTYVIQNLKINTLSQSSDNVN